MGMSDKALKVVGHLTFVFVLIMLVGTVVITTKKSKEMFDDQKSKFSVMFFYQEGCGHCHDLLNPNGPLAMLASRTATFLSNEGDGKNCNVDVDFSKAVPSSEKGVGPIDVNLPENKDSVAMYRVSHTPFVVLVDSDGKKLSEFSGPKTCEGLAKWINTNIPCIPQTLCASELQ